MQLVLIFAVRKKQCPVRWVSGLNQQFAKLSYGNTYRGFESPSHRKIFGVWRSW
jgi:hypothetical protein